MRPGVGAGEGGLVLTRLFSLSLRLSHRSVLRCRVLALSMAAQSTAGGHFDCFVGGAQEEALWRHSSLPCSVWPLRALDDAREFPTAADGDGPAYTTARAATAAFPMSAVGAVYSPCVAITRDGSGRALPAEQVCACSVVSLAAQDARSAPFDPELAAQKIRTVLHVAAERGHDALVLGALGCGVFQNPPASPDPWFRSRDVVRARLDMERSRAAGSGRRALAQRSHHRV